MSAIYAGQHDKRLRRVAQRAARHLVLGRERLEAALEAGWDEIAHEGRKGREQQVAEPAEFR